MSNIPHLTLEDITKLRTPEIDLQIRWHRRFDPAVPAVSTFITILASLPFLRYLLSQTPSAPYETDSSYIPYRMIHPHVQPPKHLSIVLTLLSSRSLARYYQSTVLS
ncbi:hypothetical protein EDB19DRAFT_1914000 [Suillus lakei]|nr:hypothetical protein EDB19DRAFT_1914000 [Suillus lakei]